jgi:CMP-N-acetylneuraminic acid synthetase
MSTLAIVPARENSKGIPNKNFRPLAGETPMERAVRVAHVVADVIVLTSDTSKATNPFWIGRPVGWNKSFARLIRPPELARDDTPMIDVVKHVLAEIPGPDDQIIVLLEPTQPLRKPEHVTRAIDLLQEAQADSVVSVVPLPPTHSPELVLRIDEGQLWQWCEDGTVRHVGDSMMSHAARPQRRQDATQVYMRDGTVYAFRRRTVRRYGNVYGDDVVPLIIPARESCPLDTPEDWAEAERRLRARD